MLHTNQRTQIGFSAFYVRCNANTTIESSTYILLNIFSGCMQYENVKPLTGVENCFTLKQSSFVMIFKVGRCVYLYEQIVSTEMVDASKQEINRDYMGD